MSLLWSSHLAPSQIVCLRRGSGSSSRERTSLDALQKSEESLPAPDAKPEYHNIVATVTSIDADQTPLYYDAAPDTGRKVRAGWQGGRPRGAEHMHLT